MNRSSSASQHDSVPASSPASPSREVRVRDIADPKQVLADKVDLLYRQAPLGIAATLVVGAIASSALWFERFKDLMYLWSCVSILICAACAGLIFSYRRRQDEDHAKWLRWHAIGALALGTTWGLAGSVFFPSQADEQQVFLAFLLTSMASGGIAVFSAVWWVYALYGAGILIPFAYALASFGNQLFVELALLVPLFYAANVAVAVRLDQVFTSGFRSRQAYKHLTDDYTALNRRLERQLVELSEARTQVEASGRKLALFAERAPIAVLELDSEGRVLHVNHAAENLFGYAEAELAAQPVNVVVRTDDRDEFERRWNTLLETREPMQGLRIRHQRRDGVEIICEWTVTPLVNAAGSVLSVIAQGQDVTRQLEAERLKKEFTSTLSHELRTPLTSIIGSLQLINSGVLGDLAKDQLELTQIAERNGQRLLDLINDILDIEKIESGKLTLSIEVLALDELVRESLALNQGFAERFKVRLQPCGELLAVQVNADRKRLQQVLTNLLSNAAKFSPEGGTVEVAMQNADGMVRVDVHDRGPGIPDDFRGRIFGRFAQADMTVTKQKGGTGLGLAICKRLIELMGGRIGFDDRDGGGSTFYFELPRHPA